ncbi:MAG TPA: YceI family protein [Gemmatimonadaceae bacterium]|nr:YceI family protein [Gemmatimonadaceae bacterium]
MTTSSSALSASGTTWAGPPRVGPLRLTAVNASVRFVARFLRAMRIRGSFERLEGELVYEERQPSAGSLVARVDVASIRTGNRLRDAHLRSAAWFDARRHPHIGLRSTGFEHSDGGLRIRAVVTVRGREAPVDVECSAPPQGAAATELMGRLTLLRSPYGVGPPPHGVARWDPRAYLVDDAVSVELRLRLDP